MESKRKCFSCKSYDRFLSAAEAGVCRRYPPQMLNVKRQGHVEYENQEGWQPTVSSQDWCGEHKFDKRKFAAHVLAS